MRVHPSTTIHKCILFKVSQENDIYVFFTTHPTQFLNKQYLHILIILTSLSILLTLHLSVHLSMLPKIFALFCVPARIIPLPTAFKTRQYIFCNATRYGVVCRWWIKLFWNYDTRVLKSIFKFLRRRKFSFRFLLLKTTNKMVAKSKWQLLPVRHLDHANRGKYDGRVTATIYSESADVAVSYIVTVCVEFCSELLSVARESPVCN